MSHSLRVELSRLSKATSPKHVHETRVALRRWASVWAVLQKDHWESKTFRVTGQKKLRRLLKLLGNLRDWDVNLELAKRFGAQKAELKGWSDKQRRLEKKVRSQIRQLKADRFVDLLEKYLACRPRRIKHKLIGKFRKGNSLKESAYLHLERFLSSQERVVKNLEPRAQTAEELHHLRLEIKQWRYLLAEFFGLSHMRLVQAQQYLGRLHDLNRLEMLLADKAEAKIKLLAERDMLLNEFNQIRQELPYGLRPYILGSFGT